LKKEIDNWQETAKSYRTSTIGSGKKTLGFKPGLAQSFTGIRLIFQ